MASCSSSGCGGHHRGSKKREVPYQDYSRIKSNVLGKIQRKQTAVSLADLYTDPSFPPNQSSLTYVYSGDDKYEKIEFKRPKEISPDATLIGIGGVCVTDFPYHQWKQKAWFRAAVVIASLSSKYMSHLIPGYRNLEQSFDTDYIGAFRFNLWRFGEWIEVVVDDNLPVLDGELAYCGTLGSPPEFWAPLLEKAYAKCCKTYEAIEVGKTLDALTDLTGAICEHFTPDITPPENFFHLLYKSSVNRSFMVCWRNEKRLTSTGFDHEPDKSQVWDKSEKYLHMITATSKFPTTDGRFIEMVRLKSVFKQEPKWHGKFSDSDTISWESLNKEFADKYKPLTHKDDDEFWICLEDFQCNFGGLVICSSPEPSRCQGFNIERKYSLRKHSAARKTCHSFPYSAGKANRPARHSTEGMFAHTPEGNVRSSMEKYRLNSKEEVNANTTRAIRVKETYNTVKVDNSKSKGFTTDNSSGRDSSPVSFTAKHIKKGSLRKQLSGHKSRARKLPTNEPGLQKTSSLPIKGVGSTDNDLDTEAETKLSVEDTYSTSDIYITVQASRSRENSIGRPRSAPAPSHIPRAQSTGSISSLTQSTFLATRADHFRSHGSWHQLVCVNGTLFRESGSPRLLVDSKNFGTRVLLTITKPDPVNENIALDFEGRSHVLISLIQDYRRGSSISGILMAHIGFYVYKTKNPEKDEKRSLSKLSLVAKHDSRGDSREITARLDLLPGNYFIVPYCSDRDHEGDFLLRVLGVKDTIAAKAGCLIS
ncbi:LOW QUALITY PROTEIN: calpain-1 catalytic subunit-like [Liolophura sinensis]|uniref:LOW QUALITY PROTEIN: calpain-1 catalytic subunit-like n=1 Tax=Liolophura sinensis TaxID=3198878 RepID=UPI00315942BA